MQGLWLIAALGLAAATATPAQTFPVKTGTWETTTRSAALPRPVVAKDCVTRADLAQLATGGDRDDDDDCKPVKPATLTGNRWVEERRCADGASTRAEFVAESAERVTGTIVRTGGKAGPPIRVELSSRWLGAACTASK